jgi:hypothetical protein
MQPTRQPLLWQGRLQLGDEPGTFGDATFAGLGVELPITVHPMPGAAAGSKPALRLVLNVENMTTYPPYPGHRVSVVAHELIAGSNPPRWKESGPLLDTQLGSSGDEFTFDVDLSTIALPAFFSVRVHCDVTVAPGLYNDFVLTRLSAGDPGFACYGTFGFEYGAH